jgi:hypothetical protein
MTSILTSLVVVVRRCYMSACVWGIIQKLIEIALTRKSPPPYWNNLFLLETQKHES